MSEEEQMDQMIDEMFDDYIKDGFDFNTSQSLHDIFKGIFKDAVELTIAVFESAEDEEEEEA